MKKFFIQDVKEGSIQSGYLFILINVVWFAGGIAGLDYGNFDRVLQLFWSFSLGHTFRIERFARRYSP